jgi:hypothetical protein
MGKAVEVVLIDESLVRSWACGAFMLSGLPDPHFGFDPFCFLTRAR